MNDSKPGSTSGPSTTCPPSGLGRSSTQNALPAAAHARIASILRKANEALAAVELPQVPDVQLLKHPAELALIRKMLELPVIIDQAVRDLAPHHLTYYAQDLASVFSQFYRDCKVVDADAPVLTAARLQLCRAAKLTLARTLELMGMSAPEAM